MSKEFKNIDDLFKSTIGMGNAKAPAHIKTNVMTKIGGNNWWMIGAALLFVTAISAIAIALYMPTEKAIATYQPQMQASKQLVQNYEPTKVEPTTVYETDSSTHSNKKNLYKNRHNSDAAITSQTTAKITETGSITKSSIGKYKNSEKKSAVGSPLFKSKENVDETTKKSGTVNPMNYDNEEIKNNGKRDLTTVEKHVSQVKNMPSTAEKPSGTEVTDSQKNIIIESRSATSTINNSKESSDAIQTEEQSFAQTSQIKNEVIDSSSTKELATHNNTYADNSKSATQTDSIAAEIKIEEAPKQKKGQWMIGVNVGPSINNVNYGKTEFSSTLNKFHGEKLGYTGQVYGQYTTSNKIVATIGAGFEIMAYNTAFLTSTSMIDVHESNVFSHYIYDDSTNMIIDSVFITQYDTTETIDLENHYGIARQQYLQIPISIGYQIEKNKWIFGADLGLQVNYLLKASGSYYRNNEVKLLNANSILKRTVINYSLGGNLQYNVYNNVFVLGQIRYSPAVQNYYITDYGKRSINSVALKIGLSLKL